MAEKEILSPEWLEAVRESVNAWPTPEERAKKLDNYWQWCERAASEFQGTLALGIRGLPSAPNGETAYVALDLDRGRCTGVRAVSAEEARQATFALAGSYSDWKDLFNQYDMGKAVMYRKIRLESGDLLAFFFRAFYFIEVLSSVCHVPTRLPA